MSLIRVNSSSITDSSIQAADLATTAITDKLGFTPANATNLSNVDNTQDVNKPISTATQTALNGKQDTLVSGTNIKTVGGTSILGSGDLAVGDVTLGSAQTITAPKRGTVTVDNDLSFDMSATNNFACTTAGSGTLTFTNITAGQSGFILLTNASNHTISAAATTKVSSTLLTRISASGTYLLSYFAQGGNVYVVASEAFA